MLMTSDEIILGAGCFWGVQFRFDRLPGVLKTAVGYSGGHLDNPSYRQVCTGQTGHAEAVFVEFDTSVITLDQVLNVFWELHDPTQIDRQGPDIGSQYRSAIFYFDDEQKDIIINSINKAQINHKGKVATEVSPVKKFWPAEEYHQKYLEKNGKGGCRA